MEKTAHAFQKPVGDKCNFSLSPCGVCFLPGDGGNEGGRVFGTCSGVAPNHHPGELEYAQRRQSTVCPRPGKASRAGTTGYRFSPGSADRSGPGKTDGGVFCQWLELSLARRHHGRRFNAFQDSAAADRTGIHPVPGVLCDRSQGIPYIRISITRRRKTAHGQCASFKL